MISKESIYYISLTIFFFNFLFKGYIDELGVDFSFSSSILLIISSFFSVFSIILYFSNRRIQKIDIVFFFLLIYILSSLIATDDKIKAIIFIVTVINYMSAFLILKKCSITNVFGKLIIIMSVFFVISSFYIEIMDVPRLIRANSESFDYICGADNSIRWCGITYNPNYLAMVSYTLIILILYIKNIKNIKIRANVLMLSLFVLIIFSMSRTFIIATFITFFFRMFLFSRIENKFFNFLILLIFLLSIYGVFNYLDVVNIFDISNRFSSSSGRLELSIGGWDKFLEQLLIPRGLNLNEDYSQYFYGWKRLLDSGYLNILVSFGLSGMAVFFYIMFYLLCKIKVSDRNYKKLFIPVIISLLFILFLEDVIIRTPFFLIVISLMFNDFYKSSRNE
ncbi:O-antigen ligase family protein [Photobacterium phosphoreum]|uniref:O-antigen ligase family protein n=1 Tax=Photobacterium phosphoreum TaxID=659 RepID=UPI001E3C2D3F|nr:O-antigen ligase family protein [Photobacterium phosphoreum]MCD9521047.1 hypothetical protein [Photobacterium phosphoreum]